MCFIIRVINKGSKFGPSIGGVLEKNKIQLQGSSNHKLPF
jgi:hypothetical protein